MPSRTDPLELLERLRSENAVLRRKLGPGRLPEVPSRGPLRAIVEGVQERLKADDIEGALGILNGTTPHRFTSVFRFDGDMLVNLHVFDKESAKASLLPVIPVSESYCLYVRDPLQFFALEDANTDARVEHHPKREHVRSYCGVAILDEDESIFGSLCHYDFHPMPVAAEAFDYLEEVARVLKATLLKALRAGNTA